MTTLTADEYKNLGNEELKCNNFEKAVELYTLAIELNANNEIYYSNRAQANIKLENYGLAINDATTAIKINKNYIKSYYRRAISYFSIMEYKKCLNDIKIVIQFTKGKDLNALKLQKNVDLILKQLAFEKAIVVDDNFGVLKDLDLNSISLESWYVGPQLSFENNEIVGFNDDFLKYTIDLFKNGGKLPKKYVFGIILKVNDLLNNEKSLVEIGLKRTKTNETEVQFNEIVKKITICGDTHGQFFDVLNIFDKFGQVNLEHCYLFNGDFVDRGSWSCEVAILLYLLKIIYPNNMFINRGNHETNDMNKVYGFEDECKFKYGEKIFKCFSESFNLLPYATLIGQEYLVMHGGLFSDDNVTINDIRKINRLNNKQPSRQGIEMELLWTDPQFENGRSMSKRGLGIQFGPDITKKFCDSNNLKCIIRSHEVRMNGYEIEHDGYLITVFSAPNYCDVQGNLGAVINLTLNDKQEYEMDCQTFKEVEHPNLPPMHYSKNNFGA